MFKTKVSLNEKADLDREVDAIRKQAEQSGMNDPAIETFVETFRGVLSPLIKNGLLLKSQGSQLTVERVIKGRDYKVKLRFSTDEQLSFWQRLTAVFRSN
ncbi:hypothetical protein [Parasphingorhabdus sp.]|jgi:hypothetical protein|uniref:hypothetical protein n=1 Tax=Parasphingorhabdus sp. TaxID=2709688 RepID=UPI003D27C231